MSVIITAAGLAVAAGLFYLGLRREDHMSARRNRIFWAAFWRIIGAFAPFLVIATFGIAGLLAWVADQAPDDWIRGIGALITGTVIAIGWLATSTASAYRDDLESDQARRDTLTALRSEIFTFVEALDAIAISQNAQTMSDRIRKGGPNGKGGAGKFNPFSVQESAPVVFEALARDVRSLNTQTVRVVVRFYAVYTDLRTFIGDTRLDDVKNMSVPRRVTLNARLTQRRKNSLAWGLAAIEAINEELGDITEPTPRKRTTAGALKNPDIAAVDWKKY